MSLEFTHDFQILGNFPNVIIMMKTKGFPRLHGQNKEQNLLLQKSGALFLAWFSFVIVLTEMNYLGQINLTKLIIIHVHV